MDNRSFTFNALLFGLLCFIGHKYSINEKIYNEENRNTYDEGYYDAYDKMKPLYTCESFYMEGYKDGKKDRKKFGG